MDKLYQRTQAGWVMLLSLGGTAAVIAFVFSQVELSVIGLVVAGVLGALALVFGWLTITVDDTHVTARFGIGLVKKCVELSRIRKYEAVVSPWYWGWGVRLYPGGWLYNVSGLHSVELTLDDGTRLRFGTAEPDALCEALGERLGELPPLSAAAQELVARRGRRWMWIVAGLAIGIPVIAVVMLLLQSRPPTIEVEGGTLVVGSVMYEATVEVASLEQLELAESLPAIRARTNGFAAGDQLRGHFRLDDLGACELFIDAGAPPFIVMRKPGQCVVVNTPDPARTRDLYTQLAAAP